MGKRRTTIWRVLCLALLLSVSGMGGMKAEAAKSRYFVSGDLFYKTISKNHVEVCGTAKTEGTLVIPSKVSYNGKSYTVTGIANHEIYVQDVPVTEDTADGMNVDIDFPGWRYYRYDRTDGKEFPNGVEWLSCSNIEKVVLPDTLTYIGEGAFGGCEQLKTVTFARKYKKLTIGKNAFCGMNLESIVFPEGTYELKENAAGITPDITIPSTVKKIGPGVVNYKTKQVTISKKNKKFKMKSGILYTKNEKKLIGVSAKAGKNIKISGKTTSIEERAFAGSKVKTVALSSKITRIPKGAFTDCQKLVSVTGAENITEIGYAAFKGCSKLTTIRSFQKLQQIKRAAFWQDNKLFVAISSDMDIDKYAFSGTQYRTRVNIAVPKCDNRYHYSNGLLIQTEENDSIVIMQSEDAEKVEVPEGITEVAVALGDSSCREILLPSSLKVQSGNFLVKGATITFKNPSVPVFQNDFAIRRESAETVTVVVPKGSLEAYKKTMNEIVMKRDDVELFWGNEIVIQEQ